MKPGKIRSSICTVGLLFASAASLPNSPAQAGFLVVSADLNIVVPLNPANGAPTPNNNGVFFNNVLNGGKVVQILSSTVANSTTNGTGGVNIDATLNTFYGSQSGVTSSVVSGTVTTASLAGVNLFVSILPGVAFSASEIAALRGFLAGGGSAFFMGDGVSFSPSQNAAINANLIALGSGMRLTAVSNDAGQQVATVTNGQVVANPLTAGVARFDYAFSAGISGGQQLFVDIDRTPFVSFEVGTAVIPEPASILLVSIAFAGAAIARRRAGLRGRRRPA